MKPTKLLTKCIDATNNLLVINDTDLRFMFDDHHNIVNLYRIDGDLTMVARIDLDSNKVIKSLSTVLLWVTHYIIDNVAAEFDTTSDYDLLKYFYAECDDKGIELDIAF